jgi:hypothetical protein
MSFDINLDCHIWIDDVAKHLSNGNLTISKIDKIREQSQENLTPESICENVKIALKHIQTNLGLSFDDAEELESLASIQAKVERFQQDIALVKASLPQTSHPLLNEMVLNSVALMMEIGIHNTAAHTSQAMLYGEKSKSNVMKGGLAVSNKNNQFSDVTIQIVQDFYKLPEHQAVKYAIVATDQSV